MQVFSSKEMDRGRVGLRWDLELCFCVVHRCGICVDLLSDVCIVGLTFCGETWRVL